MPSSYATRMVADAGREKILARRVTVSAASLAAAVQIERPARVG